MHNYNYYDMLFDYLLVYSMSKRRISDIYYKSDSSPKEKGSSSQTNFSGYSADIEEGIFVRKAQYENPLTPSKRSRILRKSQENMKKFQETQKIDNNPPWEDKLDEKWANLYMLATVAVNANLSQNQF
ncbi:hypothetical protein Hanom_Chr14g01282731 [Helianthus anomalus]